MTTARHVTPLAHDLELVTPDRAITACGIEVALAAAVWPPPDRCPRCAAISRRHIADITHQFDTPRNGRNQMSYRHGR